MWGFRIVLCDFVYFCAISRDFSRCQLISSDISWFCDTILYFVWFCVIGFDILWGFRAVLCDVISVILFAISSDFEWYFVIMWYCFVVWRGSFHVVRLRVRLCDFVFFLLRFLGISSDILGFCVIVQCFVLVWFRVIYFDHVKISCSGVWFSVILLHFSGIASDFESYFVILCDCFMFSWFCAFLFELIDISSNFE